MVVATFFAPSASIAATISTGVDQFGDHYVVLDGPIALGDAAKLANEIDSANAAGYMLDALRLSSEGGNVWEALQMAIMVRSVRNMATTVLKHSVCISSCFGVFAAGWRKYVNPAPNQIGVHSTFIANGKDIQEVPAMTTFAARRLSAIGVPDQIIAKIVLTPPEQIYFLTLDDLWAMGVNVTGIQRPVGAGPAPARRQDPNPLYVARAGSIFTSGLPLRAQPDPHSAELRLIPQNALVVVWDQCSAAFGLAKWCRVSYGADLGWVNSIGLRVIKQGW